MTGRKGNALKEALAKLERVATPQQYSLSKADAARREREGALMQASEKSHAAKRLQASFDREAGMNSTPTDTASISVPLPDAALIPCIVSALRVQGGQSLIMLGSSGLLWSKSRQLRLKIEVCAGAMDAMSRGARAADQSALSQRSRADREAGQMLKSELDLSVRGRHMGYAAAKPTAQPKHSVKWDDGHPRPQTSPEPAYGSSHRHDWPGTCHYILGWSDTNLPKPQIGSCMALHRICWAADIHTSCCSRLSG